MPSNRQRDELLRALVRQWAGTGPVRSWSPPDADLVWPALAEHRVEATLGAVLPASLRDQARQAAIAAGRARMACLLLELERILPAVRAAGDEPLILKGAGLALVAYTDPHERWSVDLDLLVAPEHVDAACANLEAAGYRPFRGRADWSYYDRHHLHRILVGPAGAVVELHWALTLPSSAYHYEAQGLRDRAREAPLGRETCRVAAPADQVVHALYQHIADGFVDLRRVLDLILLARTMTPADWDQVHALIREGRLERAYELWLHVMKSIAGVDLPPVPDPHRPLGPVAWRLLGTLDVATGCLNRRTARVPAYDQFLHLVLLPSVSLRLRDLGRLAVSSRIYRKGGAHTEAWPTSLLTKARLGFWNMRQLTRVTLAALGVISLDSS
ncbi:MAG: nucleotidyltransferase family protein [Candidatus Krumholzibacteriia bacterium]